MCRLLAIRSAHAFAVPPELRPFAEMARRSREYQGDGWGCAWWDGATWHVYRSTLPIWEDRLEGFGRTSVLLVHARSAFRNEGAVLEHTMPFISGPVAFAFNGELRGVRIAERGRTGAEKLFRFLLRTAGGGRAAGEATAATVRQAVDLVAGRTRHLRAMNFVLATGLGESPFGATAGVQFLVCTRFNEAPDYFTMHVRREDGRLAICSEPLPGVSGWTPMANGVVEVFA